MSFKGDDGELAVRTLLPELHHMDLLLTWEHLIRVQFVTGATSALLEPGLPLVGKVGRGLVCPRGAVPQFRLRNR